MLRRRCGPRGITKRAPSLHGDLNFLEFPASMGQIHNLEPVLWTWNGPRGKLDALA